jgi:phosphatidylethanolamine-binding protein (PEBP) family uncharacterized protein
MRLMAMRGVFLTTAACLIVLPVASYATEALVVQFSWAETKACSATPPTFRIANIPKGTKYLSFRLVDHNASFNHGGGEVAYAGSGNFPAGAFGGDYRGPCPPAGQVHTYEWTVEALDANKSVLAEGKTTGAFPVK